MKVSLLQIAPLTLLGAALVSSGQGKLGSQAPVVPETCQGVPAKLQGGAIHILHVQVLSSNPTDGTYANEGYGQGEFDTVRLLDVLTSPIQWNPGLIFRVHPFAGKRDVLTNFAPEHLTVGKQYYLVYTYYLEKEPRGDSDLIGLTRCGVQEYTPATRKQLLEFAER